MLRGRKTSLALRLATVGVTVIACAMAATGQAAPQLSKAVGEIKSVSAGNLVLATDDGKTQNIALPENVRVVRIAPGETDLKNATAITVQDLQNGDRVLVQGKASEDGKSMIALRVVVMKQSDVAAKQQKERDDWQKRGIGGLVSAVDPATGTVTITVTSFAGKKDVVIHTTKKTVVRRYATDSVKFDDAKPSSLAAIHAGDQLRARGTKNEDGTGFAAEEIVAGTFRNIAGTVTTVDAGNKSLTVMDVFTKKPIVVNVSGDSQLRKLPPMMAQGIAMRLKGQAAGGQPGAGGAPAGGAGSAAASGGGGSAPGGAQQRPAGGPGGGAPGGGGRGDLQSALSRLPAVALSDFQKGDAVILVSTEGNDSGVTAITMVGGVEPILTAAPSAQGMTLSPWTLGGGQADAQ